MWLGLLMPYLTFWGFADSQEQYLNGNEDVKNADRSP